MTSMETLLWKGGYQRQEESEISGVGRQTLSWLSSWCLGTKGQEGELEASLVYIVRCPREGCRGRPQNGIVRGKRLTEGCRAGQTNQRRGGRTQARTQQWPQTTS